MESLCEGGNVLFWGVRYSGVWLDVSEDERRLYEKYRNLSAGVGCMFFVM